VTTGRSGTGEIRRVSDGGLIAPVESRQRAESAAVSPDGSLVVLTMRDTGVVLLEAASGRIVRVLEVPVLGTCCAFSDDGRFVGIGGVDGRVRVHEVSSGALVREMFGHTADVRALAFTRDGEMVISGSNDVTLRFWHLGTGIEVRKLRPHPNKISWLSISPDGKWVATGSTDATVRITNIGTGEPVNTLHGHAERVSWLSFTGAGEGIVSTSIDGTVRFWERLDQQAVPVVTSEAGLPLATAASPDGRWVAAGGAGGVAVWDTTEMTLTALLRQQVPATSPVGAVRFSPRMADGSVRLAAGDHSGQLLVWQREGDESAESGTGGWRLVHVIAAHEGLVHEVMLSPDGERMATAGDDGRVCVWDGETGDLVRVVERMNAPVSGLEWAANGMLVYGTSEGAVRVVEHAGDGAVEPRRLGVEIGPVYAAVSALNGALVVLGGETGVVAVIRREGGAAWAEPMLLRGHRGAVYGLAVSPDGSRIFSGGFDNTLRVWDSQSGEEVLTLLGHTGAPLGLAVSPDGGTVYSVSTDRTMRVWGVSARHGE
jgi:WD40 repeat protein